MKLSVVIPCYNEKDTIYEIVQRVKAIDVENLEIIVVDDASQDGTKDILDEKVSVLVDKIIHHEKNRGKGAAIRSGFREITGDVVVVQDADLEYDPRNIPEMLKLIIEGKADVVYGSRFMGGNAHRVLYFWHYIGNKFLTMISNMFTNINLSDMETGYKMFRSEIIQTVEIKEDRFGFEPEITAKIARGNNRIYEVGISYFGRTYLEGKKIGWKDGFWAIYAILKYNIWNR